MWDFIWVKLTIAWSVATASIMLIKLVMFKDLAPHDTHKSKLYEPMRRMLLPIFVAV